MRILSLIALVGVVVLAACNNKDTEAYYATADSTQLADISGLQSSSRKILHNADASYRVGNVLSATVSTERMVNTVGGVVVKSEIINEANTIKDIPYTSDSIKRTQVYTATAHLMLKVPVEKMDTVMQQLAAMSVFTNSRTIAQQDLTFQYLSNAMKNEKAEQVTTTTTPTKAIPKEASVITDTHNDAIVDRRVANLQLLDDINYGTLNVDLVQPEQVDVQVVVNTAYATRIPFGVQLSVAGGKSIEILKGLVLVLVQLWPIWLMIVIGIWLYRARRKVIPLHK